MADPNQSAPSPLKARLGEELRAAMKARERVRMDALRMLTASVKNREVEVGHALSDDEFEEVAVREVKRRQEAIEAFDKGGRPELAAKELEEKRVLETYLPPPLSEDEVDAMIEDVIAETGATGPGDLGKVMGSVMARGKGRMDGRAAQAKVRARLQGGVGP